MPKFRKKPVEIEAIQYVPGGQSLVESWMVGHGARNQFGVAFDNVVIHTLEGTMTANPGDWIIRGVKGEFYPCKPDIFATTYDEVVDAPAQPIGDASGSYDGSGSAYWNKGMEGQ